MAVLKSRSGKRHQERKGQPRAKPHPIFSAKFFLYTVLLMVWNTPTSQLESAVPSDSEFLMAYSPWLACDSVPEQPGQLENRFIISGYCLHHKTLPPI